MSKDSPVSEIAFTPIGVVNTEGGVTWDVMPGELEPKQFVYIKNAAPQERGAPLSGHTGTASEPRLAEPAVAAPSEIAAPSRNEIIEECVKIVQEEAVEEAMVERIRALKNAAPQDANVERPRAEYTVKAPAVAAPVTDSPPAPYRFERDDSTPLPKEKIVFPASAPSAVAEKPLNTDMDAQRWAREFIRLFGGNVVGSAVVDEALMIGWFANAIMCGHDNARWEYDCPVTGGSITPLERTPSSVRAPEAWSCEKHGKTYHYCMNGGHVCVRCLCEEAWFPSATRPPYEPDPKEHADELAAALIQARIKLVNYRGALQKIKTLKSEHIDGTEFSTGPLALLNAAQRIAKDVLKANRADSRGANG